LLAVEFDGGAYVADGEEHGTALVELLSRGGGEERVCWIFVAEVDSEVWRGYVGQRIKTVRRAWAGGKGAGGRGVVDP
jgi:hypothetical protein